MRTCANALRGTVMAAFLAVALTAPFVGSGDARAQGAEGKTLYLVEGTGGPGFRSPAETVEVLEKAILPGFEHLIRLEADGRILAGGLPVGERAFVFIVAAGSNAEADRLVRGIPFWGALEWDVTPLQSFAGRARIEREVVETIRKGGR